MMKPILVLFLTIICLQASSQHIFNPPGLEILEEASGDLDNDSIPEKVIVYETTDTTDLGTTRELRVFKQYNKVWKVWMTSRKAILKSQEGGMMGDPFQELAIKKGILNISFAGGSSWKWNYTDRYRFQNNTLELIGYTSVNGKLCEYWEEFDYNMSTGKIVYKKDFEDCDDNQKISKTEQETFISKRPLLNLQNRYPSNIRIKSPKLKRDLYL